MNTVSLELSSTRPNDPCWVDCNLDCAGCGEAATCPLKKIASKGRFKKERKRKTKEKVAKRKK